MKIKTKISFKEYCKLLFALAYKKTLMKLILSVAFILLLWIFFYFFKLMNTPAPTIYQYITLGLIILVQPTVIYLSIRRNYYSSNHLKETLEIEFTNQEIKVSGESFYTELTWKKTFKVTELENWFLIYQNNFSAIIIPKKSFKKNLEEEFRELLSNLNSVTMELISK
jgi:hypothetical protein